MTRPLHLAALLLAACSSTTIVYVTGDATPQPDAANAADAAPVADTGVPVADTAPPPDTAPAPDVGSPPANCTADGGTCVVQIPGAAFGVDHSTIGRIERREKWAHVPG